MARIAQGSMSGAGVPKSECANVAGDHHGRIWEPAYDACGQVRPGVWIAELVGLLDLGPAAPPPRPVRGPDPRRQRHRAAQSAPARICIEPDLVRAGRDGLRTHCLDADARPRRARPRVGTPPACRPWHPADPHQTTPTTRKDTQAHGTPPTPRDSRAPRHRQTPKTTTSRSLSRAHQDRERSS
jgi:hypothetical protein